MWLAGALLVAIAIGLRGMPSLVLALLGAGLLALELVQLFN